MALLASGVVGTLLVIVSRADVDDATPATATPASGGDPTVATSMVPASEPTSSGAVDDTPGPLVDIEAAEAVFESVRLAGDDVALPGDLEVQCLGIRFPLDTLERLEPALDADPELIRVAEPYLRAAAGRSWPHELWRYVPLRPDQAMFMSITDGMSMHVFDRAADGWTNVGGDHDVSGSATFGVERDDGALVAGAVHLGATEPLGDVEVTNSAIVDGREILVVDDTSAFAVCGDVGISIGAEGAETSVELLSRALAHVGRP